MKQSLLTPPASGLERIPFSTLLEHASSQLPQDFPHSGEQVLVGLDLDGTLLNQDGASDLTRQVIADLQDAGAAVVIATGRGFLATEMVLEEVGISDGWAVCSNGAILIRVEDGEAHLVENLRFDPAPVIDAVLGGYPQALLAVEDGRGGYRISAQFPPNELIEEWVVKPLEDLRSKPVTKLVVRIPGVDRDQFERDMLALELPGVEVAVGWTSWMDVGPAGVTKATGLESLRQRLGVPSTGTVAIGDGSNDIAMLQWAHLGVAMAGASQAVRSHANMVTGPVEFDGAAAVMRAIHNRVCPQQ